MGKSLNGGTLVRWDRVLCLGSYLNQLFCKLRIIDGALFGTVRSCVPKSCDICPFASDSYSEYGEEI